MKKTLIQQNLVGQPVHMLNMVETYRMVKCGDCGRTVKASKAKTHLSYGKAVSLCNECLKKGGRVINKADRNN